MTDLRAILYDAALGVTLAPIGVACAVLRAGLHALEGAVRVSEELHAFADARRGNQFHIEALQKCLLEEQAYSDTLKADLKEARGERDEWRRRAEAAEADRDRAGASQARMAAEVVKLRHEFTEACEQRDKAGNRAGHWEGRALAAEAKVGELDDLWQAVTEQRDAARAALATVQEGRDRWREEAHEQEKERKQAVGALRVAQELAEAADAEREEAMQVADARNEELARQLAEARALLTACEAERDRLKTLANAVTASVRRGL